MLGGCGSAPPSPELTPIVIGCPTVTRCTLSATDPSTNGELLDDQDATETDWAACAAKVDIIYACQQKAAAP
ncbi:Rz1-like lysis system protein LysC [Pseudomonas putida]|uniref:Rz1-like lysis system protein LysC n=1 Tax=Pseudomonas putida TaxID=303 RepID=UPI00300EF2EA